MFQSIVNKTKPLIGFFPLFYNLAETGRAVVLAKRYLEIGGHAVFFSHGGRYEHLASDLDCEVIPVAPLYSDDFIKNLWKYSRLEKIGAPFSKTVLQEHVQAECQAYKHTGVDFIVSTNNFPCALSARMAKIPLISITPKVVGKFQKYPDDADFSFLRFIPESLKLKFINWYFPRSKLWSRPFNKIAKKQGIRSFRNSADISSGDYTFYTDFIELLNLPQSEIHPNEFFIGPIFFEELFHTTSKYENVNQQIEEHIKKGRSILVTLGSSGTQELFMKILETLNSTKYRVIASYSSILNDDKLPNYDENILIKKFFPSIQKIHKMVDLSIIHGGQGTVYTAAYAGKPIVGFPMQFEQHLNLELLIKQGVGHIESRKNFNKKSFLKLIQNIFDNYDTYLTNAQKLSKKLPKPDGDKKALNLLLQIIDKTICI